MKTVRIDYVQLHRETAEEALQKFTAGFDVTAKVHKLHGTAGGNPVAEITGEEGEVDSLLLDLAYDPRDVEVVEAEGTKLLRPITIKGYNDIVVNPETGQASYPHFDREGNPLKADGSRA